MNFDTKEKYNQETYEIIRQYYSEYFKHYVPKLIFIINDKISLNMLINSLIRCAFYEDYSLDSLVPSYKDEYILTFKRNK